MKTQLTYEELRSGINEWYEYQLTSFLLNEEINRKDCSIADFLQSPQTIENLAKYFNFHPIAVERFLNCWISMKLLCKQKNLYQFIYIKSEFIKKDYNWIMNECKNIVSNGNSKIKDYARYFMEIIYPFFQPEILLSALKTNESQWFYAKKLNVKQVFELCSEKPELLHLYTRLFQNGNKESDKKMLHYLDIPNGVSILDIGGGVGQLADRILMNYPNINNITLYEYKKAKNIYFEYIEPLQNKYPKKLSIVFGDFFFKTSGISQRGLYKLDTDKKFDYIFLGWVLHDWDDKKCEIIINNAKYHLLPNGKIIILESVLNEDGTSDIPIYDILMLITANGIERKYSEFKYLLENSGFQLDEFVKNENGRDFIVASQK